MATFLSLYNDIEYKIKQIALRYQEYEAENQQLRKENEQLKNTQAALETEIQEIKEKYKLLAITRTLLKKEDKQETKRKINDLVREIDQCITLLNSNDWSKND